MVTDTDEGIAFFRGCFWGAFLSAPLWLLLAWAVN